MGLEFIRPLGVVLPKIHAFLIRKSEATDRTTITIAQHILVQARVPDYPGSHVNDLESRLRVIVRRED